MSLSELAAASGVPHGTIRFYETMNMLRPSLSGGERRYGAHDAVRLQLVLTARRFGLSFEETRRLILGKDVVDLTACVSVAQVEERLKLLQDRRRSIDAALRRLHDALERLATTGAA